MNINLDLEFLRTVGYNLPALVVMLVGMIWTHITWHRHPPAARWSMIAFLWLFFTYFLTISWHTYGFFLIVHPGRIADQTPVLLALSCCEGIGYIFFIVALNAARTPYRSPSFYQRFVDDDWRDNPEKSRPNDDPTNDSIRN